MAFSEADILSMASEIGSKQSSIATEFAIGNGAKEMMEFWFNDVVDQMGDVLFQAKGRSTNLGSRDLIVVPNHSSKALEISIEGPDYWAFVDKGVNGLESVYSSPFSFKSLNVAPSHQLAIQKWMGTTGIQPEGGQSFAQAAYAIARSSKKNGIAPTNFVSKVLTQDTINQLESSLLAVTGAIIKVSIKKKTYKA